MKKWSYFIMSGLLIILTGTMILTRNQNMSENWKYLNKAKVLIEDFEKEMEPERLREAYLLLENVDLTQENHLRKLHRVRAECLSVWLKMIQLLDRYLDPAFNPDDVIETLVQPPPTLKGVVYPPGTDPKLIDDPKARAKYEQDIAANQEKLRKYRIQIYLNRLNDSISSGTKKFILSSFNSSPSEQFEVKLAIEKIIKNQTRKEDLLRLITLSGQ